MKRVVRQLVWTFLGLAGCASHSVHPLRPMDVPTAPFIEGAAVQDVDGSLAWEDGCLWFRADDGERLLPIWPRASVFNGTSLIYHSPGKTEQPLLVNEQIEISGERLPTSYAQTNFATYLQRCGGSPFFVAAVRPAD